MNSFVCDIPVKVYFGENQLSNLEPELRKYGTRVLVYSFSDKVNDFLDMAGYSLRICVPGDKTFI